VVEGKITKSFNKRLNKILDIFEMLFSLSVKELELNDYYIQHHVDKSSTAKRKKPKSKRRRTIG